MSSDPRNELRERLGALPDALGLLEGLFALSPVPYAIFDSGGSCLLTNPAYRAMFAAEPPPEYNVFQDEIAARLGVGGLVRRAFAGETIHTPTFWYDPKELLHIRVTDAKRVAIACTFFPLLDVDGQVSHVAIAYKDLTAELEAQERMNTELERAKELERRLRMMAEAGALLSSSLDYEATLAAIGKVIVPAFADWCFVDVAQEDGRFQRVAVAHAGDDSALAEEIGSFTIIDGSGPYHPPTEALLSGRAIFVPEIGPAQLQQMARSEKHVEIMRVMAPRSVIAVPLVARARTIGVLTLVMAKSERRYTEHDVGAMEDLAGRVALAADNARLYREARDAIQLRDEFLSIASHELKTPLTPLQLQVETIARKTPEITNGSTSKEWLEQRLVKIVRYCERLNRLVNELLDVSRIVGGQLRLELEPVDLASVVHEVVSRFADQGEVRKSACEVRIQGAKSVVGTWDHLRVDQIVTNLVSNALKYGAKNPVTIHVSADATSAKLAVSDRGIGIAQDAQDRIFGRFERAASSRHYSGLGLGLYIARQLVEAMHGTIGVMSAPERGATFIVTLPLQGPTTAS